MLTHKLLQTSINQIRHKIIRQIMPGYNFQKQQSNQWAYIAPYLQHEKVIEAWWHDSLKQFYRKKHMCQNLFFINVAGLRTAKLLKKRLWHRFFPVIFAKFLRAFFFTNTPCGCFWILWKSSNLLLTSFPLVVGRPVERVFNMMSQFDW